MLDYLSRFDLEANVLVSIEADLWIEDGSVQVRCQVSRQAIQSIESRLIWCAIELPQSRHCEANIKARDVEDMIELSQEAIEFASMFLFKNYQFLWRRWKSLVQLLFILRICAIGSVSGFQQLRAPLRKPLVDDGGLYVMRLIYADAKVRLDNAKIQILQQIAILRSDRHKSSHVRQETRKDIVICV